MCYSLNFGYNHGQDCYRILDAETGRVAYSRDVTWHHQETTWITPIRAAPTEPPRDIYISMPQSVPVAALSPAPVITPLAPAPTEALPPPPTPAPYSPAPNPPRVSRKLESRDTGRCPGGRLARHVHCAMHHGKTPVAMVYHWTMRLWCQCWRKAK